MQTLTLPATSALSGTVVLPGSKSISNRALLLAALCEGTTHISNLLDSDDVAFMLRALATLGIDVAPGPQGHTVVGAGGPLVTQDAQLNLDLGLAGTALRPLTAALTLGRGTFVLDGTPRMRERPIAPLVEMALNARIIPTTVPNSPSNGVTVAMPLITRRYRRR